MVEDRKFKEYVTVRFTRRDDGGLQAKCDEVPGFYLSGADARAVMRDVVPALETILQANLDMPVSAVPLRRGIYVVEEKPSEEAIPEATNYVIERKAA